MSTLSQTLCDLARYRESSDMAVPPLFPVETLAAPWKNEALRDELLHGLFIARRGHDALLQTAEALRSAARGQMTAALEYSADALISSLEYEKAVIERLMRKLGLDLEAGEEA